GLSRGVPGRGLDERGPRPRRGPAHGRRAGPPLRPVPVADPAGRLHRDRSRGDPAPRGALGETGPRGTPGRPPFPLPLGPRPAPRLHRPLPGRGPGPDGHRGPPRVHPAPLVAAPSPQPDRAPDQGGAALPPERGHGGRAVPPGELTTWSADER